MEEGKKKKEARPPCKGDFKMRVQSNFEISHSVASQYSGSPWGRLPSQFSDGGRNHSVWFTDFLVIRSHIVDAYFLVTSSSIEKAQLLEITSVFPETQPS